MLWGSAGGGACADAAWQAGGTVTVNGKSGGAFLKQGTHMVFPVLAIAQALGKNAAYDAASNMLSCGSVKFAPSNVVVQDKIVYVGWRDLHHLIPDLEYGVNGSVAVFSISTVHSMPQAGLGSTAQSRFEAVVVVNAKNPGEAIGPVTSCLVAGNYTIVEFFSEY